MPPSSQTGGRPRLKKESSTSSQSNGSRNIRDFFKPFTIPRNRIPVNDVVEDEIVVAVSSPQRNSVESTTRPLSSSPVKSQSSVGRERTQGSSRTSTPTKGRRSPVKGKAVPQLDEAGDLSDLLHESPPSSQQRIMTAVSVPTPTRMRSPAPPPPPTQADSTTSTSVNTTNMSFNSMSSLTSVPLSSQASSSRRMVKNGIPLVTNSDSGSAEDSEDELQDIVIPRKKMRMTPPPGEDEITTVNEAPSTIKPPTRTSGRLSAGKKSQRSSRAHTPRRRVSPSPPRAANMSSLLQLIRDKERREKAESKIREAETAFETEQKVREEKLRKERDLGGGLKALVAEDSDEGERMMLAVERTEAMGGEQEDFFYFQGIRDDAPDKEPRADDITAFAPWNCPKFARLKGMVLDAEQREQAVLSGFLAEVAGRYGLPPEVLDWMFARLVREEREEVREGYVEVFRRCLESREVGSESAVKEYGARLSRVYRTVDVSASDSGQRSRKDLGIRKVEGPPPGLGHVVRIVQNACSTGGPGIPDQNVLELALASIDAHVSKDAGLKHQLQDSISAIIDSMEVSSLHTLACKITSGITSLALPLRCRIIAALPAHTEKSHRLRRTLALYLLDPDRTRTTFSAMAKDPNNMRWGGLLHRNLSQADPWRITESTDYTHLNALIPMLDIAIDAGFTSPDPPPCKDGKPLPFAQPLPRTDPPTEKEFNEMVDRLADMIRFQSARIRDAGTSHLRRTEAKSALERVVVRLEHCVRTRPRPRKGVFGGGGEQKGLFGGFLGKGQVDGAGDAKVGKRNSGDRKDAKQAKHPDDKVNVVPEDNLSDRDGDSEREEDREVRAGAEEGEHKF